ncbi:hypothetical protein L6452_06360 [Arctium lappa]|uniref:Uncharacterized protein n=1 Tax=Arctium lappa TaxID=4217 RepID=A0ACB9EJL7_ARCLA|nr:hypothetical protein L6452_06360 [Arctium lappa]
MTSKDALSIGTDVKPPVLLKGEYEQWKDRFLDFVDQHSNGENILLSITEGPMAPITVQIPDVDSSDSEDGTEERDQKMKTVVVDISQYSEEQKSRYKADKQARSLLLQSIPNEIYIKIYSYKGNAKKMWDQLQKMMMGSKIGNQMKVANCINSYEEFKAQENESLEDTYERFILLLNELSKNKTLRKNEEEVEEKRAEKKKAEKVPDPIALVAGEKKKEKKEKKKKKKVITSSESESESDGDDGESLKQAMLLLTRAFQKKFYKKPGSNSQRYSSSSSKNHEHREKVEGRRYEENRYVEKKPDDRKKYVNDYTVVEKPANDSVKCYNYKQQEAGIALMAEDEFWLDHSEGEEEEKEETAHLCLMGKELNDLQLKLKKEKDRVAKRNNKIFELNKSVIGNKDLIDSLRKSASDSKSQVDCFEKKISDFEVKVSKYEFEKKESALIVHKLQVENKLLNKKVNGLEAKLYARGQTDQTIFFNAPDEEADVKKKWGLGFKNPHYLKKDIRKQPALYNFDFLACAGKHTHLKPKFVTKLPEEVEAKETENRKNVKKMQLSFNYAKLNDSYLSETPKVLSNDYFASYSVSEMKVKPAIAKVYVPPLILESKIIELENVLSDEKLLVDIEQSVFSTVLKNTVLQFKSTKCSTVSKAPQTSTDNFDDLFESANDFLNSDGGCIEEIDMFDFNASLPDHSTCLINEKVLPSVLKTAKSSTKVGESISVTADYYSQGKKHKKQRLQKQKYTGTQKKTQSQKSVFPNKSTSCVSDLSKKRLKARTEWRPKRKGDEKVESVSDNSCNRSVSSDTDVVDQFASNKQNLVTSYKRYSIKQLIQLSPISTTSYHYRRNDFAYSHNSSDWFGSYHVYSSRSNIFKGYGDIIQDNITISKVSYVEGLGHKLFSIGQFCDKGLEVNFKAKRCSVRTEDGNELLVGNRKTNLYTINLSKTFISFELSLYQQAGSWEIGQRTS